MAEQDHGRRVDDRPGIRGWLAKPARRVVVETLYLIVIGVVVWVFLAFQSQADRIAKDETQTCHIQARGLPASHALAASMRDIRALLSLPPSAAQRQQRKTLPPATLRRQLAVVADLNAHLTKYLSITDKQPKTRRC